MRELLEDHSVKIGISMRLGRIYSVKFAVDLLICPKHLIEGVILQHENDDMLDGVRHFSAFCFLSGKSPEKRLTRVHYENSITREVSPTW